MAKLVSEMTPEEIEAQRERSRQTRHARDNAGRAKWAEYNREHYRKNTEQRKEWARKSRLAYPERIKARRAIELALRRGDLVRPEACERCGETPARASDGRSRIHAHHHRGYDDPLEVEWVCSPCHGRDHRE